MFRLVEMSGQWYAVDISDLSDDEKIEEFDNMIQLASEGMEVKVVEEYGDATLVTPD